MRRAALPLVTVLLAGACSVGTAVEPTVPTTATGSTPTSTVTTVPVETTSTEAASTSISTSLPATTVASPQFDWSSETLGAATRASMEGVSWRPGCPVPLDDLRLVRLVYWGFDDQPHWGQLVVNSDSVTAIVGAFQSLFESRFPIRQMRLVDDFGGDDEQSMAADNTSAFNCRLVPGSSAWSEHAYGRALDINPLENPWVHNGQVDPPSGAPWVDRTRSDPAMIAHGDAAWQAFIAVGWKWGGDWSSLKDYQHFSANGR
jgi:hypothetical protein